MNKLIVALSLVWGISANAAQLKPEAFVGKYEVVSCDIALSTQLDNEARYSIEFKAPTADSKQKTPVLTVSTLPEEDGEKPEVQVAFKDINKGWIFDQVRKKDGCTSSEWVAYTQDDAIVQISKVYLERGCEGKPLSFNEHKRNKITLKFTDKDHKNLLWIQQSGYFNTDEQKCELKRLAP